MWFILAALAALVVISVIFRRRSTPSVAMFEAIQHGILDLQQKALRSILPDHHGEIRGFDEATALDTVVALEDTIRFLYSVEEHEGGFLHLISSQLIRPRAEKYQIQCMLVVMLVLNRQLGEAGVQPEDVRFELTKSELGTHYVGMHLTAEQHRRLFGDSRGAAQPNGA
jgi:hypothetical protein